MIRLVNFKFWSTVGVSVILLHLLGGCSVGGAKDEQANHAHVSMDNYEITSSNIAPAFLDNFTKTTRDLYMQVVTHATLLKNLKCYCGCLEYSQPHDSLYRCFVIEEGIEGSIKWTDHGAKCGICMMEIRDAVKLSKEGKSFDEIRDYIDSIYGEGA